MQRTRLYQLYEEAHRCLHNARKPLSNKMEPGDILDQDRLRTVLRLLTKAADELEILSKSVNTEVQTKL
jgi:hypothetical protein